MVMFSAGDGLEIFPAASFTPLVIAWAPGTIEPVGVSVLVTESNTDGTRIPSTKSTGVSPLAGDATVKLGRLLRVKSSEVELPVSVAAVMSGAAPGAAGVIVSITTLRFVGALTLPTGSVAVTTTLFAPSSNGVVGATDQVPSAATIVVSTSPLGVVTVITSPGTAPAPEILGVESLVVLSPTTAESVLGSTVATGADGAFRSMVIANAGD